MIIGTLECLTKMPAHIRPSLVATIDLPMYRTLGSLMILINLIHRINKMTQCRNNVIFHVIFSDLVLVVHNRT